MPHGTAAACGSALKPCHSRQHGLLVGQCLTELLVYSCTACYCAFLLLVLLAMRAVTGTVCIFVLWGHAIFTHMLSGSAPANDPQQGSGSG